MYLLFSARNFADGPFGVFAILQITKRDKHAIQKIIFFNKELYYWKAKANL